MPDGYVNVYNISSVVCPKGGNAIEYHNRVLSLIEKNKLDVSILEDPIIHDENNFKELLYESPFVIMGFVRDVFKDKVEDILLSSKEFEDKRVVMASDKIKWPSHPRRWRTDRSLKDDAIEQLSNIILKNHEEIAESLA